MKKIKVYYTVSKKFVEIEVSDEVGTYYNRTGWNIENNGNTLILRSV